MIVEVEDETRDFATIYRTDFPPKESEKLTQCRPPPNYPPPFTILNGPYKKYLNTARRNLLLPLNERSEDPQECLNRIRDEYPRLKRFLPEIVPEDDLIEQEEKELTQTVYQLDYSKDEYSPRVKIYGRKDVVLPDDWTVSETIQRKSYRNPWKIASESLLRVKKIGKPCDNLTPSRREREILRVRTGDSEYNGTIDATGNRITEGCLLGVPLPLEPRIYSKGPDSPQSECSRILESKPIMLPSNVL